MIPTDRHVEYALGYIGLGLLKEAEAELNAVAAIDRESPTVLMCWLDLHMRKERWTSLKKIARRLTEIDPQQSHGWVMWAYALRELNQVKTAITVLLRGKALHGKTRAIIHYNLACYHCLLGDFPNARLYLATACRMDASFKACAAEDRDLVAMRGEIAEMS